MISKNLNIQLSIFNSSSESLEGSNAPGLFLISPESCEIFQKMFFNRKEALSCFKYRRRKVGHSGEIINRWHKYFYLFFLSSEKVEFCSNHIRSSKYTFLTFWILNPLEQFRRMANFTYLLMGIVQFCLPDPPVIILVCASLQFILISIPRSHQ